MYIVNKTKDTIVNLDISEALYIGYEDHTIKAVLGPNSKMYKLGSYNTEPEAKAALAYIFASIEKGQTVCFMPGDEQVSATIANTRENKQRYNGYKPERRGGS